MNLPRGSRNVLFLFLIGLPVLVYIAYFLSPSLPKRSVPAPPPIDTRLEERPNLSSP